jgi:hypothetical protein
MPAKEAFDASYYGRFYGSERTRVHGAAEIARLCAGVTASSTGGSSRPRASSTLLLLARESPAPQRRLDGWSLGERRSSQLCPRRSTFALS